MCTLDENDGSDLVDIDNAIVLLPTDPDRMSDTEKADGSSIKKIKEKLCTEVRSKEVAGMIEFLLLITVKNITQIPNGKNSNSTFNVFRRYFLKRQFKLLRIFLLVNL